MLKICIIVPYFGCFPTYFQLFLNSCERNAPIRWLIITDNIEKYIYPSNIDLIQMSFGELKELVQSKFEFPISLERAYKLCDYKPAYGYIFHDFIADYEFWGHCDVDLIWGDIISFLQNRILLDYDKIFDLGHFTLYKNTLENNLRFKSLYNQKSLYKQVFSTNHSCIFDELYKNSINNIYEMYEIPIYSKNLSADIFTKSSNFLITYLNENKDGYLVEKKSDSVFTYEDGHIYRYKRSNKKINKQEYAYIHLQKRKMKNKLKDINASNYLIIPNSFLNLNENISLENWNKIKKKNFNLHYFKIRIKNLKTKIKQFMRKN